MNPEQSSRDEIEMKITALLLGELPAAEAKLLRYAIAQDAGLQKLHDELAQTIVLVREVEKAPASAPAENAAPLKLSEDRRAKLLAQFKKTSPLPKDPLFWLKRIDVSRIQSPRLLTVLAVLAIVALLAAISLPNFVKARSTSKSNVVINNLRQIDAAKQQWALENKKTADAAPTEADLKPYLTGGKMPQPVAGETYVLGRVSDEPAVEVDSKTARKELGSLAVHLPRGGKPDQQGRFSLSGALQSTEEQFANADIASATTAASMPPVPQEVVTLAAEPVLAPPPVTIVLPSTPEVPQLAASTAEPQMMGRGTSRFAQSDFSDEKKSPATTPVPEQKAKGINGQISYDTPALARADTSARDSEVLFSVGQLKESVDKPAQTVALNSDSGALGVQDRFAGVEKRLLDQGAIAEGGTSPATEQPASRNRSEVSGLKNIGLVVGGGGGGGAGGAPMADNNWAMMDDGGKRSAGEKAPANLGEELRRNAPAGTANASAAYDFNFETAREKLPASTVAGTFALNTEVAKSKSENPDQGLTGGLRGFYDDNYKAGDKFYRQTAGEVASVNGSIAPGAVAPPAKPVGQTESLYFASGDFSKQSKELDGADKSGSSTLALGDIPKDAFTTGTTKADVNGSSYAINPATGLPMSSSASGKVDSDAQRELAQMEEVQKLLDSRIKAVRIDASLPTYTMVELTKPAEPNKTQSFWQGLKGEYSSVAQVKVENEGAIIAGFSGGPAAQQFPYDPYFVQTTFEIIKSEKVLGKVVDALKLDSAWANQNSGNKLTKKEAIQRLQSQLDLKPVKNTKLISIGATSSKPEEAAKIANAVAEAYKAYRFENNRQIATSGLDALQKQYTEEDKKIRELRGKIESAEPKPNVELADKPLPKPALNAPVPQPEILTRENNFSTFSLNVSDVSFKLAAATLEKGQLPDAASIRSEEFINAFDYRDPEAAAGQPLAFVSERARYPFAQNRDLLRFSVKTAAAGRAAGQPLNLVLLLDNSGSMERADRVAIIREALRVLGTQLQSQDKVSVVTFARTARLWADGVSGDKAGETLKNIGGLTPEGGTNLEEAMRLAYETAHRHYAATGMNRVVLLTDGAANLGDVNPADLKQKVEAQRKQGIALDCFGIGQEDYNDDLLEQLSRNGDGRYAFLNSPEEVSKEFAAKLAGALQIAASDVKVQVEFNPQRVISYRQIGYAKHQLTKQQFRDNTVDAAEIAAQEAGNALYTVETKTDGIGPIATVRVRYKVPGTTDYRERSWDVPYEGSAVSLAQSSAAMRLAATASAFSEWLVASPFAQEVTPDELLKTLSGVPQIYGADQRPQKLEWMIRQAKSVAGK